MGRAEVSALKAMVAKTEMVERENILYERVW